MRIVRVSFIAVFALLGMVGFSGVVSAQVGWTIEHFNADIVIQDDGSVRVTERIAVDFALVEKHGIYRDLPVVYQDRDGERVYTTIKDILVYQDGAAANTQITRNDANMRIRIGDPNVTISGPHQYDITYTVTGVLQSFADVDELYWNVTGNDWEAPITSAVATVTVPADVKQVACYAGPRGSTERCGVSEVAQSVASFQATNLAAGSGLTVAIGFAPGAVPIITVQAPPSAADVFLSPTALGIALLLLLGGAGTLLRLWWRYGRDRWWQRSQLPGERSDREGMDVTERILPLFHRHVVSPEYDPPDDLRPAEIGVLMDERADTLDISATIVDLASRGYMTITEIEKKWMFGKQDYELTRTDKVVDKELRTYEKELLTKLFDDGKVIALSSLKNTFYKDLEQIKELLYKDVVDKKLFAGRPDKVRLRYVVIGVLGVVVGIGLIIGVAAMFSGAGAPTFYLPVMAGAGMGLVGVCIVALITAQFMPRKTGYGRELYQRSLGYELFVSGTEKYRAKFYENEEMFVAVLSYAIMFGVTDKLAKAFAEMGIKPPQPVWYHGAGAFNVSAFADSMHSFSTSLSATMAARPGGSGSGGGGFSGGGFGGGGGGSW